MNKEIFQDPGFHPELARGEPAESVKRLTTRPQTLYSEKEGLIFHMEGEQGEVPKIPQTPSKTTQPFNPPLLAPQGETHTPEAKRIEAAQEVWKRLVEERGRPLTEEEKAFAGEGKSPAAGGETVVETPRIDIIGLRITDGRLIMKAGDLNNREKTPSAVFEDPAFLRQQVAEIDKLAQTDPTINEHESKRFIDHLKTLEAEALRRAQEKEIEELKKAQEERMAEGEERERQGYYGARMLTRREKERLLSDDPEGELADSFFNRMFVRVDAKPRERFRDAFGSAGEIEYNDFLRTFTVELESPEITSKTRERLYSLITKYSHEKDIREIMHDANFALLANVNSETFIGFLQQFTSDMADTIYRTEGVTLAAHLYEQALRQVINKNDGFLPVDEVAIDPHAPKVTEREGWVEKLTRKYFDKAIKQGLLKTRDKEGNLVTVTLDKFPQWKKDRAIALARGVGIATLRTIEILADVKLPKEAAGLPSLYGQDIIRDLVPFRQLVGKFGIGIERLAVLAFAVQKRGLVWSQKELLEFMEYVKEHGYAPVVNGDPEALSELGERYIKRINPLESGSIFSHTGWRAGAATDHMSADEKEWMGTGIRLERLRGNYRNEEKRPDAKRKMVGILRKVAEIQPLKLYYQMPQLGMESSRDEIIERIFNFKPEELRELREAERFLMSLTLDSSPDEWKKEPKARVKVNSLGPKKGVLEIGEEALRQAEADLILTQEQTIQGGILSQKEEDLGKRIKFQGAKLKFEAIPEEGGRRANAEKLAEEIKKAFSQSELEKLAEKIGRDDWPFVFGTEDVPFDEYRFVKTGPTGIARSARDFDGERKAAAGIIKLIRRMDSYGKIEDIINDMREGIYENVSMYDEEKARRVILELAEGVAKFYSKDWWARLPFGMGTAAGFLAAHSVFNWPVINRIPVLNSLRGLKSSYAKTVFGNEEMAWDEKAKWDFTKAIQASGMLSPQQIEELRRKIGATRKHLAWWYVRTRTPLGIIFLLFEIGRQFTKGLDKELTR